MASSCRDRSTPKALHILAYGCSRLANYAGSRRHDNRLRSRRYTICRRTTLCNAFSVEEKEQEAPWTLSHPDVDGNMFNCVASIG